MNWYKTSKNVVANGTNGMNNCSMRKFAKPEDKIKKFGVEDRFTQAYIYQFENSMPWGQITSIGDIRKYISEEWKKIRKELESIKNLEKKNIIDNWLAIMHDWNDMLSSFPGAGSVILFKSLLEWVKKHKNPPPIVMPEVANNIMTNIYNNPSTSINFMREYRKLATPIPREDGWHKFEKYSDKDTLSMFTQGSGWCISHPKYASHYLSLGDIYIYVQNSKPVLALVTTVMENTDVVYEVRGPYNRMPYEYKDVLQAKVRELGLSLEATQYYNAWTYDLTIKIPEINKTLNEKGTESPEGKRALKVFDYLLTDTSGYLAFCGLDPNIQNKSKILNILFERIRYSYEDYNGGVITCLDILEGMCPSVVNAASNEIAANLMKLFYNGTDLDELELMPQIILDNIPDAFISRYVFDEIARGDDLTITPRVAGALSAITPNLLNNYLGIIDSRLSSRTKGIEQIMPYLTETTQERLKEIYFRHYMLELTKLSYGPLIAKLTRIIRDGEGVDKNSIMGEVTREAVINPIKPYLIKETEKQITHVSQGLYSEFIATSRYPSQRKIFVPREILPEAQSFLNTTINDLKESLSEYFEKSTDLSEFFSEYIVFEVI